LPFEAFNNRVAPSGYVEADATIVRPTMATAVVAPEIKTPPLKAKRVKGGSFLDFLRKTGMSVGSKHPAAKIGLNPFELGYNLGHDVIAPALMKRFPRK
jgi:hypothetical protein